MNYAVFIATSALIVSGCGRTRDRADQFVSFRQHELEAGGRTASMSDTVFSGSWVSMRPEEKDQQAWAMLEWIAAQLPDTVNVYPTEGYYYFRAGVGGRTFSGNLRIVGQELPKLSFAYFDVTEPRDFRSILVDPMTDQRVMITKADGESSNVLKMFGRSIDWRQDVGRRVFDASIALLNHEEPISGVFDESGVQFYLVFNEQTRTFHYLLSDHDLANHRLVSMRSTDTGTVTLDPLTGFLFYEDRRINRRVLVGVSAREVEKNSYFDGPFDQVPPDLDIAGFLKLAYPYVAAGGGIDEHGEFIDLPDVRVAISPYMAYPSVSRALLAIDGHERAVADDPASLIAKLCYEPKREFNPEDRRTQAHPLPWPANHFGTVSRAWPSDHDPRTSASWPANHRSTTSVLQDKP